MKNRFLSTVTAIALALPLGIGGLTLTAPVAATNAQAQTAADHYFHTCSVYVIWRCKSGLRDYIFHNGHNFGYTARALPFGSDGADFRAFDYLFNRLKSGTLNPEQMKHWSDGFNTIFPDGVRPPVPPSTYINAHQELLKIHRELQGFQVGGTPEERQASFERECRANSGIITTRFQFAPDDLGATQCRLDNVVTEDPDDPDAERTIESTFVSFNPNPHPDDNPLDQFVQSTPNFLFQVTAIDPFSSTNMNPFDDEEGEAVRQHREAIIELQDEVTGHDEAIATMLAIQSTQSDEIRSNTGRIGALNSRVDTFGDDIQKNTAGVALAYAFPSSGLNYNESFRLSGGAGYFREEAAVAFGFTGRLSPSVTASGGVGLADGVSGARVEIGYGW